MLIEVTRDDVGNGQRFCSDSCPVALAIKRATGAFFVVMTCEHVMITKGVSKQIVRLPPDVIEKVLRFDRGHAMEPFSFELEVTCQ